MIRRTNRSKPMGWARNLCLLLTLALSSCTLSPSFTPPASPLLLSQTPESRPIFVDHPPTNDSQFLWFMGQVQKAATRKKATDGALAQAFGHFFDRLSQSGYRLTEEEKKSWFRVGGSEKTPRIAGQWVRVYEESSDKPFIHQTSVYLLLQVPRSYEQTILHTLRKKDRREFRLMNRKNAAAMRAFDKQNGSLFLGTLREALMADRRIHSNRSFSKSHRTRREEERRTVESLWRRSLRGIRLSLVPPSDMFPVGDHPIPPVSIKEKTRIILKHRTLGLSGLSFFPSLHPFHEPEPLVFPGILWLVGNDRPILSQETLVWEFHLFRQPPFNHRVPLAMACSPTDSNGMGQCQLARVHVPGNHGYLEGVYGPVSDSPLSRPFFRTLLRKTVLEIHFRFYHQRTLHPILLSFRGMSQKTKSTLFMLFADEARRNNLTLCQAVAPKPNCPGGPPTSLLILHRKAVIAIEIHSKERTTSHHRGFSVFATRLSLIMTLSDIQGTYWTHSIDVTGRAFSPEESALAAWTECARRLSKELSTAYFPAAHPHPGESFYDH